MSDKISRVIQSSSNYCKLSDGTLIQWGARNIAGHTEIWFPQAFLDTNYAVTLNGPSWAGIRATASNVNKAYMLIYADTIPEGGVSFTWIAIGRWK